MASPIEVIQKNGHKTLLDLQQIQDAISKASASATYPLEKSKLEQIITHIQNLISARFLAPNLPSIEQAEDIIEETLMAQAPQIAKAYIIQRHESNKAGPEELVRGIEGDLQNSPALQQIVKRDGSVVPFDKQKIAVAIQKAAGAVGTHDKALTDSLANEVVWYLQKGFKGPIPTVEEIQDIVEEVLIKHKLTTIAKAYILYRDYRARLRQGDQKSSGGQLDYIPYKKIWSVLNWNLDHDCETVEKLNRHIRGGTIQNLIQQAEAAYHEDVAGAAQAILERKDKIRLVIIAGPSSSGKTTTTIKVAEHLRKQGLKLVALNIDNYFFNLECHPRDEFGDYDFETPEALDLALINQHLQDLMQYKPIQMPRYNFKTGKRMEETQTFQVEPGQIILIDTLHGLYNPMTHGVAAENKFKLYIETLCQLKDTNHNFVRWTDVRLLRRMTRDRRERAYDPQKTIEHWHYVRRSELKHIIPYIHTVDYIVNGSLCYELPILKKYMYQYFPDFLTRYQNDPARQDAYIRAKRVAELLGSLEDIENIEELVPRNSLMREFIGGSSYDYHGI